MSNDALLKKLANTKQEQKSTPVQARYPKIPRFEIKGEGIFRFRIIGNLIDPEELPFEQVFIHLGFTHPNLGIKVPIHCNGKNCSLCAYHRQKENQGAANAWTYKCNQRFIYYALDEENKLVLLSLTFTQQNEVQAEMIGMLKSGVNIMDLNAGRWIEITSRKINNRQKYVVNVEDVNHAIPEDMRTLVRSCRPLKGYYSAYSEEDLKKILRGEKIQFAPKTNLRVPPTQNPEPPPGEEKKYKTMQSMVENKPKKSPQKPVYDSEVKDNIEGEDVLDNARLLDEILKDE